MKKYAIMVFHSEFDDFLTALQEKGVLHIVRKEHRMPREDAARMEDVRRIDQLVVFLKGWASYRKLRQVPAADSVDTEYIIQTENLKREREVILATLQRFEKEYPQVAAWGVYSTKLIEKLKGEGIQLKYYSCPKGKVKKQWFQEYSLSFMSEQHGMAYLVAVLQEGETLSVPSILKEEKPPQTTLVLREKKKTELTKRLGIIEKELDHISQRLVAFKKAKFRLMDEFEFLMASVSADREIEHKVMVVEGWCPEPMQKGLNQFLDEQGIMYVTSEADPNDPNTPIELKNSAFAALFEPITRLFSLPAYTELDPTPFFAPFYMLFFGFCFGDGGYGLFFILLGFVLKRVLPVKVHGIISLSQMLGLAAVVFGLLTGTVFGISLTEIRHPIMEEYKKYALSREGLMTLSLILGGVQILFAMGLNVVNISIQKGFKYAIGNLSWLCLIVLSLLFFGLPYMGVVIPGVAKYGLTGGMGIALLGIFFYNTPQKNIWMNFGTGIWNSYNMATGVLGDMLSYIRLFALGLTGGILGGVFNNIALTMTGNIPLVSAFFTLLILLIGHSLNIGLCTLGSLVHPLRLTFVEFYKNSGFSGGGKAYVPFMKETK